MSKKWNPDSWRKLPIKQQPPYQDKAHLHKVETQLSHFPPLVTIDEVEKLKAELLKHLDSIK